MNLKTKTKMKNIFILLFLISFNLIYCQNNGYIIRNNDTINVQFIINELTVRSFGKIEKLQKKVKYKLNGVNITSRPSDINGFCIKSKDRNFYFDTFYGDKKNKGTFLFRVIGNKVDKLTVYQFYSSDFIGVNYNANLGYLIKKENHDDYAFSVTFPKVWKAILEKIVEDCPVYHKYVEDNIQKILFEDEFENYLNEYVNQCLK